MRGKCCNGVSVRGIRKLKPAASTYKMTRVAMAASGGVSMPVSVPGRSNASKYDDATCPINCPPSTTPMMMDMMVSPASIHPLALTNWEGGNNSVRMPYLAGE